MASLRILAVAFALSLAVMACQSADKRADNDQIQVVKGVETVCDAQADVDAATDTVNNLSPESTVADAQKAGERLKAALSALNRAEQQLERAEVKEYRDQVGIFSNAVDEVSKSKDLTLAEVSEQLKAKAVPLLEARRQLMSATVCIDADESAAADAPPESEF
ncbi:hypothetical protein [Synechococcus sp. MIT S9503]|uniref:hypothetical protein n=1 Tax=Synechococcus sp. MIT S9503 TaxID=3082547 RepID=UPI0039A73142